MRSQVCGPTPCSRNCFLRTFSVGVRGSSATGDDEDDDGDDKLIQQALEIIQKHGSSISASFLQRKLRIGYPRAARLMEDLQALGHVEARPSPTRPKSSED